MYVPITKTGINLKNAVLVNPGDDVTAKYNWLKSSNRDTQMGALSATNRRTLILTPGKYTLSAVLVLDTDYVDVVGISIDPEATVVELAGGDSVVEQTADTINFCGFKIYNSGNSAGDHAFEVNASDNSLSTYRFMDFRRTYAKATASAVLGTSHINGLWEFCKGGDYLFNTASSKNLAGTFRFCTGSSPAFRVGSGGALSGTFEHCTGGDNSFGGGTLSGTFTSCTSGDYSFGGKQTGAGNECSGTFRDCTVGDSSFAMGAAFSGTAIQCVGGARCFGGNYDAGTDYGTFTGEARDCVATSMSFGGGRDDPAGCSGKLFRCRCTSQPSALRVASGVRLEDCYLQSTGSEIECVLVKTDTTPPVFYNCTLIAGSGTAYSIKAIGSKNIVAVQCRANKTTSDITNLVTGGITTDSDIT